MDTGPWAPGHWTLDTGHWTTWTLDIGHLTMDFNLWTLDLWTSWILGPSDGPMGYGAAHPRRGEIPVLEKDPTA